MKNVESVSAHGLRKTFKVKDETIEAVRGIDLQVGAGEIFGFLGPNGAGKTTALRMLTTLLPFDEGEALVAGFDVRRQQSQVRRNIGYVSQVGGSDPPATGRENLVLQAQLYGASTSDAAKRAKDLIDIFELGPFADRLVQSYSGGQRRRLDVALGIVHRPEVLFLDEPTTGLDPQNRANLWDQLRQLRESGTTIFLTTHYLEEADALADRVAIVDHGQVVALGTPEELKRHLAGDVVTIKPRLESASLESLRRDLQAEPFVIESRLEGERVRVYVEDGARALPLIFDWLKCNGVDLETIALSAPSLDDVFLDQTGRSLRDAGNDSQGQVMK